ncbi:head GIN domain-containing protein [Mucilaginibacter polytrichastri]|uniref:Putative auto-transporter adhesin head GIN domain-containing protein n=1 Tax=Mucilaginibacter polytrichastri TaxID=1302689 RepID=A0A1Q6A6I4_9SPHI|nr:head GIN domain-containing protein [Mucilaginibacter polytrichastri]OKS89620.1 hypothetical protein RG47T_5104 [Mucilaginibacter polytrichastri]SFT24458.1 Putative auto-transporter adhesin, head GIN domain [Mucilaginibacter polytrichastri]
MKVLTKIFFALLLIAGVNSAFADTQDRHLTGFKAVDVAGSFDVYITQGNTESVKVEAPSDVMDRIKTEVQDGVLKIYNKRNADWNFNWFGGNHKKMIVYVTAKDLNAVTVSGSGDVSFKDGITTSSLKLRVSGSGDMSGKVQVKDLQTSVSGSGDVRLIGSATSSDVRVSGSGDYRGGDLTTLSTAVHVSGSGDASVNASTKIDASVSGSGDIRYSGGAKSVSKSKSGSGDIHGS